MNLTRPILAKTYADGTQAHVHIQLSRKFPHRRDRRLLSRWIGLRQDHASCRLSPQAISTTATGGQFQAWIGQRPLQRPHPRSLGLSGAALLPLLSVRDNVGFGIDHLPRHQRRCAHHCMPPVERIGLANMPARWPACDLSGGQQQRVASPARLVKTRPTTSSSSTSRSPRSDAFTRASLHGALLDLW